MKLSKKSDEASKDVELLETNSNLLDENINLKERIKQVESSSKNSSLENENQVLRQKVNSLDLNLKNLGIILNVEKENRKIEKRKFIEKNETLSNKILELEKLKVVDESDSRSLELKEKVKSLETKMSEAYKDLLDLES